MYVVAFVTCVAFLLHNTGMAFAEFMGLFLPRIQDHLPKPWHRAVTGCDGPELILLLLRLAERLTKHLGTDERKSPAQGILLVIFTFYC